MADRFFSCNVGTTMQSGVTETASTTAAAHVEVRVTYDAAQNSKRATLAAIDAIRQKILMDTWPPV